MRHLRHLLMPLHLLRLCLFDCEKGFLGTGTYRYYFFGHGSYRNLVTFFMRDAVRYATPTLGLQKQSAYRKLLAHR